MKPPASILALCGGLLLAQICAAPSLGDPDSRNQATVCGRGMVSVKAPSELEQSLGCAAFDAAVVRLAACGITLKQPVSIFVSETVRTPYGNEAFGVFDTDSATIHITTLAGLSRLAAGTPYAAFAPTALYKSVVAHETVHAVMQQNYTRKPSSRSAYEYPAYAVQMELLALEDPDGSKSELFRSHDNTLLSDLILGLDPFAFAARAYRLVQQDGGRCGSLHEALADRAAFIVTLPY